MRNSRRKTPVSIRQKRNVAIVLAAIGGAILLSFFALFVIVKAAKLNQHADGEKQELAKVAEPVAPPIESAIHDIVQSWYESPVGYCEKNKAKVFRVSFVEIDDIQSSFAGYRLRGITHLYTRTTQINYHYIIKCDKDFAAGIVKSNFYTFDLIIDSSSTDGHTLVFKLAP